MFGSNKLVQYTQLPFFQVGSTKQFSPRLHIAYENSTGRIVLNLLLEEEGCYTATAFYRDNPVKNNTFTLLVLSCKLKERGGWKKCIDRNNTLSTTYV